MPTPEVLGRNGSYAVFRKLHQRVALFRQFLRANSATPQEEELLAAKMMGRWRSGAPWLSRRNAMIHSSVPMRNVATTSLTRTTHWD